jgi:hypothetical protein
MLFGTATIMSSRQVFLEISQTIYGTDTPLMGSWLLDLAMRKESVFVVIALAIAAVIKEFAGPKWTWLLNSLLLLTIIIFNMWLVSSLYF